MKTKLTLLAAFFLLISGQYAFTNTPSDDEIKSWIGIPVSGFIENKGQLCDMNNNPAPYLLFKLQDHGADVYITDRGLSYVFMFSEDKQENTAAGDKVKYGLPDDKFNPMNLTIHYCRADMELVDADIKKENIIKENQSTDYINYYLSNCPDGVTEVRSYGKLTIKDVYPGIDWIIYNTTSGKMRYDFVIHPNADPSKIKFRYLKTDLPEINENFITINTPLGKITEEKPFGYSSGNSVNVNYCLEDGEISFQTGEYNTNEPLVIVPQLMWATYYGGSNYDYPNSIHSDGINVCVTGYTYSANFPLQTLSGSYNQGGYAGAIDAFILKFNTSGVRQWATYYGGTGQDIGQTINSDGASIWVSGWTGSTDFPILNLAGAYNQPIYGGAAYDIFILKFNTSGIRQWATYYGGSGIEYCYSIYSDGASVWLTGYVSGSTTFPLQTLSGAYNQAIYGGITDAFILKFSTAGVRQWATYYGGSGQDVGYSICSDGTNVWVTGETQSSDLPLQTLSGAYNQASIGGGVDIFLLKFNTSGVRQWSTYYGGSGDEYGTSIHSNGSSVWLTGHTASTNFPVQTLAGAYNQTAFGGGTDDAFILKFSSSGVRNWATYYGGNNFDFGYSIHSDSTSVWITGVTSSNNFPLQTLSGAYNQTTLGGGTDAFIIKLNTSGIINWSTYYGGSGDDHGSSIHTDGTNVWATGNSNSSDLPLQNLTGAYNQTANAGNTDAYILKLSASAIGINLISSEIPATYSLNQNYPNPFNPTTVISFQLTIAGQTTLKVYDILGKEVATLVNEKLNPGTYGVSFDGSNYSSGVYFYKLAIVDPLRRTDNFVETKKMILNK